MVHSDMAEKVTETEKISLVYIILFSSFLTDFVLNMQNAVRYL